MNRSALKHILFIILTALICLGFSSQQLLNKYDVAKVASTAADQENSEASEKSETELSHMMSNYDLSFRCSFVITVAAAFYYHHVQLPDFFILPSTPPPDLA